MKFAKGYPLDRPGGEKIMLICSDCVLIPLVVFSYYSLLLKAVFVKLHGCW